MATALAWKRRSSSVGSLFRRMSCREVSPLTFPRSCVSSPKRMSRERVNYTFSSSKASRRQWQSGACPRRTRSHLDSTECVRGAVKFAKENADVSFKLAREIANAKDLQELLSLQTRYVQSQMRWYADQTQEFGQVMAGALGSMEASAGAVISQTLTHVDPPEDVTSLKLTGFSIEVDTDPVTLLMQTDRALSVLRYPKPSYQILFMRSRLFLTPMSRCNRSG